MPILNQGNDSFENDLKELYEMLQQQRSALLDAVLDVQVGARLLMTLEAGRLEQQHGADDPRVTGLRERADTILARANVLAVEREIAGVRAPPTVKTGALVQGRVTDHQCRAAGRVSVRLVAENGTPVAGIEPVEADDAGFYMFVLKPETVTAIGAETKVTVALRDGEKDVVPAAAKPFTIAPDVSVVQEVTLSSSELVQLHLRLPDLTPPPVDESSPPAPQAVDMQPQLPPVADTAQPPARDVHPET